MKNISLSIGMFLLIWQYSMAQSMEYFIERGTSSHPEIQKWTHWEDAVESEIGEVKAWPGPEIQMGYGLVPVETRVGPQIFRAGISQGIVWPGLKNAKAEVVEAQLKITNAKRELSEKEIALNIKNQYLRLYMINKEREYLRAYYDVYEELRSDRIRQMEGGQGHYSDVLLTERGLHEIELKIEQIQFQWQAKVKELSYWAGIQDLDTVELQTTFSPFAPEKEIVDESRYTNYPSIESLETEREKVNNQISLNQWSSYPQLMVGVDYIVNAARPDVEIPGNGRDAIMPKIGLTLPFFSSKYSNAEEKLKAQSLAYEAEKSDELSWISQEIYAARKKQEEAFSKFEMYKNLIAKTEEIIDLIQAQIGADHTRFAQFWDYQNEILRYRLKQLDELEVLYRQKFIIEKYESQ